MQPIDAVQAVARVNAVKVVARFLPAGQQPCFDLEPASKPLDFV
jgi:hypothetical protein